LHLAKKDYHKQIRTTQREMDHNKKILPMKRALLYIILSAFPLGSAMAGRPACFEVKTYTLSNGLTVWLNEDHDQPKVFGAVVVKAGAKDCPNTGIAHYFEHMMFKGTSQIGTTDYQAEKIILDSIVLKYDELASTTSDSSRKLIQKQINALNIRGSEYVIPNEFSRLISRYGGTGLNAGTGWDATQYYNVFSPQYITQWAEINSERLVDPVFRLFQSELETVYEEKNMYEDKMGMMAVERVLQRFFEPHPYAYPIVGSAENLKNPKLSDMRKFFEEYYVAGNMGLVLSGDFNTDEILPILEKTFSRIRPGIAPVKFVEQPRPIKGKETFNALLPIPMVQAKVLCWRGVPSNHADEIALNIASGLLNNQNGTGYLDKLTVDGKLLMTYMVNLNQNDAGLTGLIIVPKLMGQTADKATSMVLEQVERIKKGDFTEEAFRNLKLEQRRTHERSLENLQSRSQTIMSLISQGKSWDSYLQEMDAIEALTKEDIVRVANLYLTDNYLEVTKKTGNYPKNNLKKPGFAPIKPKNVDNSSSYAKKLDETPRMPGNPRFLDFDKDAVKLELGPNVALYKVSNPVNEVFTLKFKFKKGEIDSKLIDPMGNYLSYLGTDSLTYTQFQQKMQSLGATLSFSSQAESFNMDVVGFDRNFEPILALLHHFLTQVKDDKKMLKQVVDSYKVTNKSIRKSNDELASATLEKVIYGDQSTYLNRLTVSEIKKLKGPELLAELNSMLKTACDIHYCGTLTIEMVSRAIEGNFDVKAATISSDKPAYRTLNPVAESVVYFLDMPKSAQSIIQTYVPGNLAKSSEERKQATLFNHYFGEGMCSLVFQQIREFRSLAYRAGADYHQPTFNHRDKPGHLTGFLSTQCDKTTDAMSVMDSLIRFMPTVELRVAPAKEDVRNSACNYYPSFRYRSERIAYYKAEGHTTDPNKDLAETVDSLSLQDIEAFYRKTIAGKPVTWVVVGNKEKIDLAKLATFGKIVYVKPTEVYR
jgi:predicted Zn-dependent peptidase